MRVLDGTLRLSLDLEDFLRVAPEMQHIVDFDFVPLINKDSTNMNPSDWTKLAKAVYDRRDAGYNGFVIAHGTDTMHFSAAALSFAFGQNLKFPVVMTGAQTIPEIYHGDARVNLLRACKVATSDIAEVVISFGEYVFRGCRAQKKDGRFDAFESPAFPPLAYITGDIVSQPLAVMRKDRTNKPDMDLRAEFEKGILQVSLIPGFEPELIEPTLISEKCKGIILQSFGAGNVPHEGQYSFERFIHKAKELNKPVIITSQLPANATLHTAYEPGKAAIKAGAIPTGNMTSSCAVVKFRWALAQINNDICAGRLTESKRIGAVNYMMQEVYVGEMDTIEFKSQIV